MYKPPTSFKNGFEIYSRKYSTLFTQLRELNREH